MKTCSFITDLYREILRFEFTIIKVVNVNVALTHQSDDIIVSEACSVLSLIIWRQIMIYLQAYLVLEYQLVLRVDQYSVHVMECSGIVLRDCTSTSTSGLKLQYSSLSVSISRRRGTAVLVPYDN